jgi:hypothetical protein
MKKSQLKQIIKEEIQNIANEGLFDFLDSKETRNKKAAEKAAYDKRFADSFVKDLETAYHKIGEKIDSSDKWTESHKATLRKELNRQMWDLVHDGEGDVPENFVVDFNPDTTDVGKIPANYMGDVIRGMYDILKMP